MDWANQIPINRQTRFGMTSWTKLYTTFGIMRLINNSKCQLDDPSFQYISQKFSHYHKTITIRHLLSHTSGIPDYYDENLVDDFVDFYVKRPSYIPGFITGTWLMA